MYLALYVGVIFAVLVAISLNIMLRIKEPRDLLRVTAPFDSRELVVVSEVLLACQKSRSYDEIVWAAMGESRGLARIVWNAGKIASAGRLLLDTHPEELICDRVKDICESATRIRMMLIFAILETLLNLKGRKYPRAYTQEIALLYSGLITQIRTLYEDLCPECLPDLEQAL